MTTIVLDWNLGLGDAIICNGLVRVLARKHERLLLPCHSHNLPSVRHMFSDLGNVYVYTYEAGCHEHVSDSHMLRVGLNNPEWKDCKLSFDRAFYHFAGVDFEARWSEFYVPPSDSELPPYWSAFRLIHEDRARGIKIDPGRYYQGKHASALFAVTAETPQITDWRRRIEEAKEIHCVDSSVIHLVESLPTTGKLFYHRYARPAEIAFNDCVRRKDWVTLD
jgi:hypothetical protein